MLYPVVIDVSVLAKLYLVEEGGEIVQKILKDFIDQKIEIFLPSLFFYEIGNVFRFKLSQKESIETITSILDYKFSVIDLNDCININRLSYKYDVTFYDAAYHALAFIENTFLLTADKKYYEKTKQEKNVFLLDDYSFAVSEFFGE